MGIRTVLSADPPQASLLNSRSIVENALIRQYQFPHQCTGLDTLVCGFHDRLLFRDSGRTRACFMRHTHRDCEFFECWVREASDQEILAFIAEVLDQSGEWTGYRILGSVESGKVVWMLELFRKHPQSMTQVFTGPTAPNVLQLTE